jgi:hypothetical protein
MTRRDLISGCARAGLIIAAFVFIAGIIAAPILPKSGTSMAVASMPRHEPNLHLPITPASFQKN